MGCTSELHTNESSKVDILLNEILFWKMYCRSTVTLQIVQLVLAAVLAAAFIFLMILPFASDAWAETRRIAELLAQVCET